MRYSKIIGTGKYLPKKILTNYELEEMVDTTDEWIISRTGIKERRIAENEACYELAINSAKDAIVSANINPKEIDLIIVATMTSEYATPSVACLVQKEIGAKNAMAFDLSAACSGFIFGIHTANQFLINSVFNKALIIGCEKLSHIVNWKERGTSVLFGDGAGAVILESSKEFGIIATDCKSVGEDYSCLTAGVNRIKTPFKNKNVEDNFIKMNGREVFEFACKKVPVCIKNLLKNSNLKKDDIDYYILHQANLRIIKVVAKKLEEDIDKFYINMELYGNTSSASIPIALDEMYKSGKLKNKMIVVAGFGAGLTYGASIIKIN